MAGAAWIIRHGSSPAVRAWRPPRGGTRLAGPLWVRELGDEQQPVIVLLHGLASSNLQWGRAYDVLAASRRMVAPDLSGFGASMDSPGPHDLQGHLDALDDMAETLGLSGHDTTVVGHSMGAVLALHWAATNRDVGRVVAVCPPLYDSPTEADEHIRQMGLLEGLFALDSPLAATTCALMCRFRRTAALLSVVISPQWPVSMARAGVRHTWPSYLGAMNHIVRESSWREALQTLEHRGVLVDLVEGAEDPVPVRGRATDLAGRHQGVTAHMHPHAGHDLPISQPDWCLARIDPEGN